MPKTRTDPILADQVRELLESAGTVKLHQFVDGRTVRISTMTKHNGKDVYWFCVSNITTKFLWENGIGYYDLDQCIRDAESIFGIITWNVL